MTRSRIVMHKTTRQIPQNVSKLMNNNNYNKNKKNVNN